MKRYLILQLGNFGDCLYATTLAKQIKKNNNKNYITWAIWDKYKSILENNKYIDNIWIIPNDINFMRNNWEKYLKTSNFKDIDSNYDEIIHSHIPPKNWIKFHLTIRHTILNSLNIPITIDVSPVLKLSKNEIQNVKTFLENNNVINYNFKVIFECMPKSKQSYVDQNFALKIAQELTKSYKNICFIITSPIAFQSQNQQIIDASVLTFRENAELINYCNLLIGCSSGITWLSTSEWCKRIPMIQLLNKKANYFAGIIYDHKIFNIESKNVIELLNYDKNKVIEVLSNITNKSFITVKKKYNEKYMPNKHNLYWHTEELANNYYSLFEIINYSVLFFLKNLKYGNFIRFNILFIFTKILPIKFALSGKWYYRFLRRINNRIKKLSN